MVVEPSPKQAIFRGALKAKATFNFETKSSYLVNVRTTDESGLTFTKSITIKVNNVNENPTDLTVSATAFNENVAIGSTVATLKFVDPDTTGTYTYSLVSGVGDKDNQAFLIAGNALKVNVATNFEIQKTYSVRLRVTDQGGLFFEKSVALGVNNLIEKVSSAVSTTLVPDKDTLELTGTKNIFGIGNQFDNTITGNTGKNKLIGGIGKDILTGGAGVDTFFYNDLKESLLLGFDVITDFATADRIAVGFAFEGDDLIASTGKATSFNEGAISSVLTNTTFLANNAAAFTVEGLTGTFLALNDGRDGFQADSDALIHLSKYTIGSTTPISII
jgi:Ca2+-binding RTX toxin-like protein